ncbi:MAG TPA: D-alanyl-D-alanine carboxypeptidase [Fimbriimonadaceae bacterium]|nr:D-alanyl-D-alanine carboxypeptidase [Fimbriimonadaceae bacterium]
MTSLIAALLLPASCQDLALKLDGILDVPELQGAWVGALVVGPDGTALYERNPGLRFIPGSNQKLLTGAFALGTLGADWRPRTRFWNQGAKLFVDAPGDPTWTFEELGKVRRALQSTAKTVVVREGYFPRIPPSWEHDDLPNRYAAPVTAFSVDRGAFELWAAEGRLEPIRPEIGVKTILEGGTGAPQIRYDPALGVLRVAGKLPAARTRLDTLAMPHPNWAAARALGGSFSRATGEPPSGEPSHERLGPPLKDLLARCLGPSDNNLAEHLLLLAARETARRTNAPWSPMNPYPFATQAMATYLTETVGVAPGDVRPDDGSGLSRHNFVTPRALVRVLIWGRDRPEFRQALARPGLGTLRTRLDGVPFEGKTGTLDAVVCLSGYVRTKDGRELIASLTINHAVTSSNLQRDVADRFMATLAQVGSE